MLQNTTPNSTAVILAGGLGTRLSGVLPDLPKPMAPVNGHPFLEYLLAQIKFAGATHGVLCVGHKAEIIENHFGDGEEFGLHLEYSHEEDLLGTAGAIKLAAPLIHGEDFFLINGDCWCEVDLKKLVSQHRSTSAVATLVAAQVQDRARFGSLEIAADGRVLGFLEKGAQTSAGYINAGYYYLDKRVLDLIPDTEVCSLERDIFPQLLDNGLFAMRTDAAFIDIGVPEDWQRAGEVLPRRP